MDTRLRIHRFVPFTRANGPGVRAGIWVQGCSLRCPGCYNPRTHAVADGQLMAMNEVFARITALAGQIEGITVSGGEPLEQRPALLALLRRVRAETGLSVLVFTGYTWEEVAAMPEADSLRQCVDVLIAGRYDAARRLARDLRGSSNKTVHFFSDRYGADDLRAVPVGEIIINPDGEILATGVDPVL